MFLSVVIPVYNEEKTIHSVLDEHVRKLSGLEQWEIVCLDDASTDGTWDLLKEYASRQPRLRLIRHESNQGISLSFQQLFQEARGEYIYLTAGDGQWPAENLRLLLGQWEKTRADLVIGVRRKRYLVYGLWRTALSYGFNLLGFLVTGFNGQDINGIKLGRREIFIQPSKSRSFFAEIERLHQALKKGYHIDRVPVMFHPRTQGKAKGAKLNNIKDTLRDFLKYL